MAASQTTAITSKLSTSLRHLLLHHCTTRSTAIASTAVFSLTGKLPSPTITTSDSRVLRRVDWTAFQNHQNVLEISAKNRGLVRDSDDDSDYHDADDDDNMFAGDDDDSDGYADDEE